MGMTDAGRKATASRAHVLIAEAPESFHQRIALERAVDAAGWCVTDTVADADVLAVVGEPGEELTAVVDHVWEQLSEPRVRVEIHDEADVGSALVLAREALKAPAEPPVRPRQRPDNARDEEAHEHGGDERGGHDHGGDEHQGHDHGAMSPDGIPLAEGAADRDGLEMDELHLPLGPVLAHWPAGVVLRLTLHGDVVAGAEVEYLGDAAASPVRDDGPTRAARLLDAAASVLSLAGLPADAARARRLRDDCLRGLPIDRSAVDGLGMRIRRHRVLRWVLKGLVIVGDDGRPEELHDRLVTLVDRAGAAIDGGTVSDDRAWPTFEALPELVEGHELAAVRLWMAALRADLTEAVRPEPSRG